MVGVSLARRPVERVLTTGMVSSVPSNPDYSPLSAPLREVFHLE